MYKCEYYEYLDGGHVWVVKARNGKIVAKATTEIMCKRIAEGLMLEAAARKKMEKYKF